MPSKQRKLLQKVFTVIRLIEENRTNFNLLEKIIEFGDYLILTSLTFWSSLQLTRQPSPASSIAGTTLSLNEIFDIISIFHCAIILILLSSSAIHIIGNSFFKISQNNNHLFYYILNKIIIISSWLYEATLTSFLLVLAQVSTIEKIFNSSSPWGLIGFSASLFYVAIFSNRKIYAEYLPLIFAFRVFLASEQSAIVTIMISLLSWRTSRKQAYTVVYIQIFLLEINEYVRLAYHISLNPHLLLNSSFIIIIVPVIKFMYGKMRNFEDKNLQQFDQQIYKIIKKIKEKTFDGLSILEKMSIQAFYALQMQNLEGIDLIAKQNDEQTLCHLLNYKLTKEIQSDVKNTSKKMLKIRLNCLMNTNILNLFKMLEELNFTVSNQSLKVRYIVFCFIDEAISELNFKNSLDFQQIKQNDIIQSNNQREIHNFVKSLINFWEYLLKQTLVEDVILDKLEHLKNKQTILNYHLEHFKKFPNLRNNLLVLQFALKCSNPQYEISNPTTIEDKNNQIFHEQKKIITFFLSVQNDRISSMSNALCKRLGYDHLLIRGARRSTIFPVYVSKFQKIINQYHDKNQFITFPLVNSEGYIQPFKGKLFVNSTFEGYLSFFVQFEEFQNDKYPYMIINVNQEYIDYVSKSFYSYFVEFQDQKINQINIEELFCYKFHQILASSLNDYSAQVRISRDERRIIKLIKICMYQFYSSDYIFIKLEITKNMVSNTILNIFIQQTIDENMESKFDKYQHQAFFCKIPHPFQNKYNEQILRLNDRNRSRFSQKHKKMFAFILIMAIFNIIFWKIMVQKNYKSALQKMFQLEVVNTARIQLVVLYEKSYKLFYMRENNRTFNMITDGEDIMEQYELEIDGLIHNLQYFRFRYHEEVKQLTIPLTFNGFTMQATTSNTNIIDITQNAKQFLKTNNPLFLVENFGFIQIYDEAYNINPLLQQKTLQQNLMIFFSMASASILFLIILFVVYSDIKIYIQTSSHIVKIIMNSKQKILEGKLKLLRHFEHFLIVNQELYFIKDNKNSESKMRRNSELKHLVDKQKQLNAKSEYDMQYIIKREDSLMKKQKDMNQNEDAKQAKKMLFTLHSKNPIFTHPIIAYCRQSYFLIIFGLLTLYFIRIFTLNLDFSMEKCSIFDYYNDFFSTQRTIVSLSTEMYQQALENYYNMTNVWNQNESIFLSTHFEKTLPGYFDEFIAKKHEMVGTSLCIQENNIDENRFFDIDICNEILGGALTKGLGITFEDYFSLIRLIKRQSSSITGEQFGSSIGVNKLSLIQLMEMLMLIKIKTIKLEFYKTSLQFLQKGAKSLIFGNIYQQILIITLILLIYSYGMKRYKRRANLIIKGFVILPKEYILNNRLLKYFTKYKIFENIATI